MNNITKNLALASLQIILVACSSPAPVKPDPAFAPVAEEAVRYKPIANSGSIYQTDQPMELFTDKKAFRVGDILSITLSEKTNATTRSATATGKDDAIDLNAGSIFGEASSYNGVNPFTVGAANKRSFSGKADSSQSNSLTGKITVMVTRVLSNGLLMVKGEKIMEINQGAEFLRFSGIVRSSDISSNNIIPSSKVANAIISYGTGGVLGASQKQGWLARFFSSEIWPF
jgi:flagellar L-ring protein precursor FlgH